MYEIKNITRIIGVLFLVQMIAAVISHSVMLQPILFSENFLAEIAAQPIKVITAMFIDLVSGAATFAIAVMLFPVLKRYNEPIALWYVGFRLTEWMMLLISGIFLLTLVAISKKFIDPGLPDHNELQNLAIYVRKARGFTKLLMLFSFCLNASLFYYLILKSALLPRFISIWGLTGVLFLAVEVVANLYGKSLGGMIMMLPIGLNEIFMGVWLIFKGFNQSALHPKKEVALTA